MNSALKGLAFFGRFANSFSSLGFRQRRLLWDDSPFDFSGQRWLVTGATGGIGRAISEAAVSAGATVTVLARDEAKLTQLKEALGDSIEPRRVDLSLSQDIRRLLGSLGGDSEKPYDVLVNNVGVLLNEHALTSEGFECSFATNLLNHFLLTEHLIGHGLLSAESAVINMSSGGMYNVPLTIARLNETDPHRYNGVTAYAHHKRAQVTLNAWWQAQHADLGPRFYVMHPGWVDTAGVRTSLPGFRALFKSVLRTAGQGADSALWLANTRPEPAAEESIWFDRALRPAHLSNDTRDGPDTVEDLVSFLERCLRASDTQDEQ